MKYKKTDKAKQKNDSITLLKSLGKKIDVLAIIFLFIVGLYMVNYYTGVELSITQWGFPLDDSWIFSQFAKNAANGFIFEYNIGYPTPGTTSPLYTLVLAIIYKLSNNIILSGKFVGVLFYMLTSVGVYFLTIEITKIRRAAFLAAIFYLVTPRAVWSALSGMEITLFSFLIVFMGYLLCKYLTSGDVKLLWFSSAIAGLAHLARPEGALLLVLSIFVQIVYQRDLLDKNSRNLRNVFVKDNLKIYSSQILIFLAVISFWIAFCYSTTDHLTVNTLSAKGGHFRFPPDFQYLKTVFELHNTYPGWSGSSIFLIGFVIGTLTAVVKKQKKAIMPLLMFFGMILGYASVYPWPYQYGRYLMPIIPLFTIFGAYGLVLGIDFIVSYLSNIAKTTEKSRYMVILSVFLALIIMYPSYVSANQGFSITYALNVKNTNDMQVNLGHWVNDNLPKDARIVVESAGAIIFFSGRYIIDYPGLTVPEIAFNKNNESFNEFQFYEEQGINYWIDYGHDLAVEPYFELIHENPIQYNTITGGDAQYVYAFNWTTYHKIKGD